ncbi:hypothetical protein [Phyllobacterium leguminum]|uniref:Uncharacterized protein n=1 Tax=Phyllobacterium leguminum TaxID=314237 RepID=A0A318T5G8_9HYPH|nr:hypothetical protein [Phyllobacterium leguminum]PYE89555.1 hypothetical protein C7477_10362 [Phyllobacterium leguminum]
MKTLAATVLVATLATGTMFVNFGLGRTGDGIPGCDGGTNPSPDGKFYIPGTKQECNPGDDDRKKLTGHLRSETEDLTPMASVAAWGK